MEKLSASMKVILVRHAQSSNNELFRLLWEAAGMPKRGTKAFDECFSGFECNRDINPLLSGLGGSQVLTLTSKFEIYLDNEFNSDRVHVYTSPLLRAILTATPLAEVLKVDANRFICDPQLHEVGGLYRMVEKDNCEGYRGWTKEELEEKFNKRFTVPDCMIDGWYDSSQGRESLPTARKRVDRVAEWWGFSPQGLGCARGRQ
eukprot:GHVT01010261.1.p1 GENE.GHVT01010261.1~~GHVT01010261.1.p1  ORF type:complete len:203 (-),score=34.14 GHVT01010261.1:1633-2241(-)